MREIKFRGKRADNGEWVYGDLLRMHGVPYIYPDPAPSGWNDYEVIPDTVGQFMGLVDKACKEIYEGDVVRANHFFVRFDGYTPKSIRNAYNIDIAQDDLATSVLYSRIMLLNFTLIRGWIMRNGSDQHRMHLIKGVANIEVIGNIHDNPELLKQND